jgi:Pyruvate/2-oxoacid:ferredoxin oxidoreductase gamma subunit
LTYLKGLTPNFTAADGAALIVRYGARCLNTALLGLALRTGLFPFDTAAVERVIQKRLAAKHWDSNIRAIRGEGELLRNSNG